VTCLVRPHSRIVTKRPSSGTEIQPHQLHPFQEWGRSGRWGRKVASKRSNKSMLFGMGLTGCDRT
jgi:hypothetical protein